MQLALETMRNILRLIQLAQKIGELLHTYIMYDNYNAPYLFTVDRKCGLKCVVTMKSKKVEVLFKGFKAIIISYKTYGHDIKQLVSDNEQVFNSLKPLLGQLGILMTLTPSSKHNQIAGKNSS